MIDMKWIKCCDKTPNSNDRIILTFDGFTINKNQYYNHSNHSWYTDCVMDFIEKSDPQPTHWMLLPKPPTD